ncbi:MAG: hypothetical protein ACI9WC_001388 [Arenicella sp.]|jgi:hypothetical protein
MYRQYRWRYQIELSMNREGVYYNMHRCNVSLGALIKAEWVREAGYRSFADNSTLNLRIHCRLL